MNNARAAAAASTPSIKGGVYLDSFDTRVIEYQYAIWKLQSIETHIKALYIKIKSFSTLIPLIHVLECMIGPLLNVNDTLTRRLHSLARLVPLSETRKVVPPVNTFSIIFELEDTNKPRAEWGEDIDYKTLLLQLLGILSNALTIYEKKLQQSLVERESSRIAQGSGAPQMLNVSILKELLIPLEALSITKFVADKEKKEDYIWSKSALFVENMQKSILELKPHIDKLKEYKQKPTDGSLKKLKDWQFSMHRAVAIIVRLSDIYVILRKFGRELYLSEYFHLHNPKILHNNIKLEVALKHCDENFKENRKNQQLVFILTKVSHQGSFHPLKHATLSELINGTISGYQMVYQQTDVLLNLVKSWEQVLKQRPLKQPQPKVQQKIATPLTSPLQKKLEVLFNPEKEKLSQEQIAKQQRERELQALQERDLKESQQKERQFVDDLNNRRRFEERERQLRDGLKDSPIALSRNGSLRVSTSVAGSVTRSRSGSNASVSSSSSANTLTSNQPRTSSLTSTANPSLSPTVVSRSPSLQNRRPNSVYMTNQAFDIRSELRRQEKAKQAAAAATTTASRNATFVNSSPVNSLTKKAAQPSFESNSPLVRRRRSSSLQSQATSANNNSSYIAAAASAALGQERHSSLKSKTEVNKFRNAIQRREQLLTIPPNAERSRSPSPLRSKSEKNELSKTDAQTYHILPNIKELEIVDESPAVQSTASPISILKGSINHRKSSPTPSPTVSKLIDDPNINNSSEMVQKQNIEPFTAIKPMLKIIPPTSSSEPSSKPPELITNETSPESSISINEGQIETQLTLDVSSDVVKTIHSVENLEQVLPEQVKIVKKVRFTGVPEKIEDDPTPKKKGWIKPPRLMFNNNTKKTSLSYAADALQQERIVFHNIKRGEKNIPTKGKWKSFRDRL